MASVDFGYVDSYILSIGKGFLMKYISIVLIALNILCLPMIAQYKNWTVRLTNGKEHSHVTLKYLSGDSLIVCQSEQDYALPVALIKYIERSRGVKNTVASTLGGGLIGGSLGYLTGQLEASSGASSPYSSNQDDNKFLYTLVGSTVGAIIGLALSSASGMQTYEMQELSVEKKLLLIESILPQGSKSPQAQVQQNTVYLKNGSVIKGNIIEMLPDSIIRIQTSDGSLFVFNVTEVEKIKQEESNRAVSSGVDTNAPPSQQLAVSGSAVSTKTVFGAYAGIAFPTGEFGSSGTTGGAASVGFLIGGEVSYPVGPGASWVTSLILTFNDVDETALSVPSGFTVDIGSWFSIWPLTGFRVSGPISSDVDLYASLQAGLLLGSSPDLRLSGSGGSAFVASDGSTSFAYGLAGGMIIRKKFTAGLRYLNGKPEYTITARGTGGTVTAKAKQSTTILLISAGINF
ncbi:MAG: hypothetical protein HY707_13275 [Ignavibacteriae bacterium]|nr:hypothetical protein [Ignavibacteriota bacterium]